MRSGLRWAAPLAWLSCVHADDLGNFIRQGLSLPQASISGTGSGSEYAQSCQSALWEWHKASATYGISHTVPSLVTAASYVPATPHVSASSVITLCDGYARAVGNASYIKTQSSNDSTTYTVHGAAPYPTPAPCSISPSDCANLYSSYSKATAALVPGVNTTVSAPPCNTNGSHSIPFSTTSCSYGGVVGVRGASVQLLYWPVRTADNPEYFCSSHSPYGSSKPNPMTLTRTPTGSGPNTFVTGSLTITSPTIALSYSDLSRIDGCGPTIEHTIITMKPEELSSVRGARALYDLYPFNFGDLNWMCPSSSNTSSFTVQDVAGPNCYQNVPAQAYWSAAQQFDMQLYGSTSEVQKWTIINNYQPYVLPHQSVWKETLQSLWGSTALWYIDGSWDPPIALSEELHAAKPTLPAGYEATSTVEASSTAASTMSTTATPPVRLSDALPSSTAGSQSMASSSSSVPSVESSSLLVESGTAPIDSSSTSASANADTSVPHVATPVPLTDDSSQTMLTNSPPAMSTGSSQAVSASSSQASSTESSQTMSTGSLQNEPSSAASATASTVSDSGASRSDLQTILVFLGLALAFVF